MRLLRENRHEKRSTRQFAYLGVDVSESEF